MIISPVLLTFVNFSFCFENDGGAVKVLSAIIVAIMVEITRHIVQSANPLINRRVYYNIISRYYAYSEVSRSYFEPDSDRTRTCLIKL
jgi:hypothetical protein